MHEFEAGATKAARARLENPKAMQLTYAVELYLGVTKAATSGVVMVTIPAGSDKEVDFTVVMPLAEGEYPVYLDVWHEGTLLRHYQAEDVTIIRGISLSFANPKAGAVAWDAMIWDINTRTMIAGTPTGIKELDVPCVLYATEKTFLLYVMELPPAPQPGPYWYGPYLVTVPAFGEYTWNSQDGKIDGIVAKDLPNTVNECVVTAVVQRLDWAGEGAPSIWWASLYIEDAAGVEGYENVGQYFIGATIPVYGAIPVDSIGQPVMKVGDRIQARLKIAWLTYSSYWWAWDFHKERTFPDSAYEFTGSVVMSAPYQAIGEDPEFGPYTYTAVDFDCEISGNLPQFSAMFLSMGLYGPMGGTRKVGPATYKITVAYDDVLYGYFRGVNVYGHPDLNAPAWGQYTWRYENWRPIGG